MDLALQLFSLHDELRENPHGTLDWVVSQGFTSVEVAGFTHLGAIKFANELHRRDLSCVGIHGPCVEVYQQIDKFTHWCRRMTHLFACNSVVVFRDPESMGNREHYPESELSYYDRLAGVLADVCNELSGDGIRIVFNIPLNYWFPRI